MDLALLGRLCSTFPCCPAGKPQVSRQSPWLSLTTQGVPTGGERAAESMTGDGAPRPGKQAGGSTNTHSARQGLASPSSTPSDSQWPGQPAPVDCPSVHSLVVSWHFPAPVVPGSGRGSRYETYSFTIWESRRAKELLHHHGNKMELKLNTRQAQQSAYEAEPWGFSMEQG